MYCFYLFNVSFICTTPPPRGCAGGRIGTWFLHPRGTSPFKVVNPAGTPGYRNGTDSFFCLKGHPSLCGMYEFTTNPSFE